MDIVVYWRSCSVVLADAPSGECTVLDKQMIDEIGEVLNELKKRKLGFGDYYNMAGEFCNCEGDDCNTMKPPEICTGTKADGDISLTKCEQVLNILP